MHQQSTLAIARKAYKTLNWSVQQSKRMPYQFHHRLTVRNCVIIYNVPLVESLKNTSGGSRGGPPLFLDQTGAWGAEKNFLGDSAPCPPSPYLRVWMTALPYLKVWIWHWILTCIRQESTMNSTTIPWRIFLYRMSLAKRMENWQHTAGLNDTAIQ